MTSILIVDDDTFLHKVIERILIMGGYTITGHAFDGTEAIEVFKASNPKPDIILMDHRMPVMSGTAATMEIHKIDSASCIIFISADDKVREEALESGASDFLTKPIRSTDLFAAIEKATH
jgi:CheY-like chemotaxis protein